MENYALKSSSPRTAEEGQVTVPTAASTASTAAAAAAAPPVVMKSPLRGRTRLEQLLIIILVIIFICMLALAITVGVRDKHGWNPWGPDDSCVNPECLKAASEFLSSSNPEVDPCDDFYRYSCGRWINDTVYAEDVTDRFSTLDDAMAFKIKDILENYKVTSSTPEHFKKARAFYKACMDTEKREESSVQEFLEDLEQIGGYPVLKQDKWDAENYNYLKALSLLLQNGLDDGIFIAVGTDLDFKNNSRERIVISQTNLGLSKKEYFELDAVLDLYRKFMTEMAEKLCQENATFCSERNNSDIDKEIGEALEVEKTLAEKHVPPEELEKKEFMYNIFNLSALQEFAPGIEWLDLIKLYFPNVTESEEIMVATPEYMQHFSKYISSLMESNEGRRKLANYIVYRHTKELSLHLSKAFRTAYYDYTNSLTDEDGVPKGWRDCLTVTRAIFDISLANMYVKKHFPMKRKKALEQMMEGMRSELKDILLATPWMDEDTRKDALHKLHSIHTVAAFPEDLTDDEKVNEWYEEFNVTEDHYKNYKLGNQFLIKKTVVGYDGPSDRTNWKHLPAPLLEANALYHPTNNSIFVPLGIVQDWFFEEESPKYMNYARIGFVIAHEFGHAFDSDGADMDDVGNWRNWWKNETWEEFKHSAKCMVDIFDRYFVPEANRTVNGSLTLTENIADDLGLAESYGAFVKASYRNPDEPLPGIDLNLKQLFWVNMASVWCEKHSPEHYQQMLQSDSHSPARFRVISTLSNNANFIRDFNCKMGSNMNKSPNKCHVWGVGK